MRRKPRCGILLSPLLFIDSFNSWGGGHDFCCFGQFRDKTGIPSTSKTMPTTPKRLGINSNYTTRRIESTIRKHRRHKRERSADNRRVVRARNHMYSKAASWVLPSSRLISASNSYFLNQRKAGGAICGQQNICHGLTAGRMPVLRQ